jgi:uncharacterized protein YjiS (DUF1127 family)
MSTIDAIERECADVRAAGGRSAPNVSKARAPLLRRAVRWMSTAVVKRRTRIHLSELTDDQLKDIGVSRWQARRETARFFWD